MRKHKTLLILGAINVLHALTHILQVVQSFFLISHSLNHKSSWVEKIMESPYMAILWLFLGIITIYLGIKDYKHHKQHKN